MTTPGTPVSLGNGVAVSNRFLIIVGFPDETAGRDEGLTRIFYLNLDSATLFTYQDWAGETVVSACLRRQRGDLRRAGCFLSEEGRVEILNSAEHLSETIDETHGSFRSIQEVGRTLFACGFGGQLYQRADSGWKPIDGGLRDQSSQLLDRQFGLGDFSGQGRPSFDEQLSLGEEIPNFNCVDGSDENDVYVCGLDGVIGHHDGTKLKLLEPPTGEHLLDIHCVNANKVIMSGYRQTLLVGNVRDGFKVLHESDRDITLYSVREFQGEIYAGTTAGLRRFRGGKFEAVIDPAARFDETTVVQQIDSVDDNYLWIVGDRHIFRYDGKTVEKIKHPDNP
jgi:hypothetical protein